MGGGGGRPLVLALALFAGVLWRRATVDSDGQPVLDPQQVCRSLCDGDFWDSADAGDVRRKLASGRRAANQLAADGLRNAGSETGRRPLHEASAGTRDDGGWTSLLWAVERGAGDAVEGDAAGCETAPPGVLRSGNADSRRGRWSSGDCLAYFRDASYQDLYAFELVENRYIEVRLRSSDADAYLAIIDAFGDVIDRNDGGGDSHIGANLRLGHCWISATTYSDRTTGDYQLTVSVKN